MRVFVTHNPEDLEAYYGATLPRLEAIADVVRNPTDHDLTTDELIEAAAGCQVIVAHRATPGEAALFDGSPDLLAFLRCAVDISTIDVDAASRNGVLVARADKSFVASTAELALGLLIDTARNISASTMDYHLGRLPPQRAGANSATGRRGSSATGRSGRIWPICCVALGMRVLVHDPYVEEVSDGHGSWASIELLAEPTSSSRWHPENPRRTT